MVALLMVALMTTSLNASADEKDSLLILAKKRFSSRALTSAEEKLFTSAEHGGSVAVRIAPDESDSPANAANWPEACVIHADCLTWLCTDPQASTFVNRSGISMQGVRIDGDVDLRYAETRFPIEMKCCAFQGGIYLELAQMRSLFFLNCSIKTIRAQSATFGGNVFITQGSTVSETLNFQGATINGVLFCSDFRITNPDGTGLSLDASTVRGAVFLKNGNIEGEVNLRHAVIGDDFSCDNMRLVNLKGPAFSADSAVFNKNVTFQRGTKIEGEVRFPAASVGILKFDDAELKSPGQIAFFAEEGTFRVVWFEKTHVDGGVRFSGAIVDRYFWFDVRLRGSPDGIALNAGNMKISGEVRLGRFEAEGTVTFVEATIGGSLRMREATFNNGDGLAFVADGSRINNVFFTHGSKATGAVKFQAAIILGDLFLDGAQLGNPKGIALSLDSAKVGRSVFLRDGFKADGIVSLHGAEIGAYLEYFGIVKPETITLDLGRAKVGSLWDEKNSWPMSGNLRLDGFVYGDIASEAPSDAASRLQWLCLQGSQKFAPQPYEQLASVFRAAGHDDDARKVMIEKNCERARHTRLFSQDWWWYNFFGPISGYGYKPFKALWISFLWILVFTGLFQLGYSRGLILPTREEAYRTNAGGGRRVISDTYPAFNSVAYALESFTPFLKFDQTANWSPNANRRAVISLYKFSFSLTGSLLRVLLWLYIVVGWILTTLWVGGLAGLIRS